MLSILITSLVYLAFCWICGLTVVRDANGKRFSQFFLIGFRKFKEKFLGLILINDSNESNITNIRFDCTYGKDQRCEYG